MEHRILSLIAAALVLDAAAQLAPQQPAPLIAHLLEVNQEWRVMDPSPTEGDRIVRFSSEAERIALHLHMVVASLQANTPEGLSAASLRSREQLLDELGAYADRGSFPQNEHLSYRTPVFIDRHNTACAVGQLMRASGNEALAAFISSEMNLAYVHDMQRKDVFAWAGTNGFSENELAWIQPSYTPSTLWLPVGNGTNATVTTLLTLSNGDLLVCGDFTLAGGATHTHVARWNGSTYVAMGSGIQGEVVTAAELNGHIYLGGTFQNFSFSLADWDGSSWSYSTPVAGQAPHVFDLHVHDGALYAAAEASGFAGTTDQVVMLSGGSWMNIGEQLNSPIMALGSLNGQLVAGGAFTGVWSFGVPDSSLRHIAALYTGEWEELSGGLDATVRDLLTLHDTLYAAGDFFENIAVTFGFARIASTSSYWEPLAPGHDMYMNSTLGPCYAQSLASDGNTIYLGGRFEYTQNLQYGTHVLAFYGGPDAFGSMGVPNEQVNSVAVQDDKLVLGGAFSDVTGQNNPYIASTDLTLGIPGGTEKDDALDLWPNPATNLITLSMEAVPAERTFAAIYAGDGRMVVEEHTVSGLNTSFDVSALAPGPYTIRITDALSTRSISFVKH